MANEHNNEDSTKEYKQLKETLEKHDDTRVFERVSEQQTLLNRTVISDKLKLDGPLNEDAESELASEQAKGKASSAAKSAKPLPPWLKITLKVLRKLLIPVLCIVALYIGLYVGYVAFGNENPGDIWDFGTWKHILDLIFADGSSTSSSHHI